MIFCLYLLSNKEYCFEIKSNANQNICEELYSGKKVDKLIFKQKI